MTRRGELLEFAVLGLLHEGPTHGYDLRRRLNTALGPFRALSYGTLYPALRSLSERGWISATGEGAPAASENGTSRRATSSGTGSRTRIIYDLTPLGREQFQQLATRCDKSYDDDAFSVHFTFFARTRADVRLRILEGRRHSLEDRLERIRTTAARNRERMDAWTSALQQHGLETTEREVRWLTELIDAERRGDASSSRPAHGGPLAAHPATGGPPGPPHRPS